MNHPETAAYIAKAFQLLREATIVVENDLAEAAGRAAYLAVFHAAQAYVYDRTGRATKSHNGVRSEFARLAKDDTRIDRAFATFLARAYRLKENADYAIGHDPSLTLSEAREAIETARRFVADIETILKSDSSREIRSSTPEN